jgi:hypothetical protein
MEDEAGWRRRLEGRNAKSSSYSPRMVRGAFSVFKSFVCNDKDVFDRSMCTESLYTIRVGSGYLRSRSQFCSA